MRIARLIGWNRILRCCVIAALGAAALALMAGTAIAQPGILMGSEQKTNWENNSAPCPKSHNSFCADEISQAQFVGWPFIAEHTGTVEAIFAALATGEATGAEVGIFANRRYHYAEIEYRGEEENGAKETWTPARFKQYEFEIPPEDPGALLGTSGKVAESKIVNNGWTEFKLETPVKVVKGEKYWLTNTTFQKAYGTGSEEFHKYQLFYHERASTTEDQPWGNYTNEPHNWEHVARTLKELPSPETTKINCEKCNTEGWLQEEPKGFDLLNTNRGAQEEGGQTYSYASGTIEEGSGEEVPTVLTGAATEITQTGATLERERQPERQRSHRMRVRIRHRHRLRVQRALHHGPGLRGRSGAGDGNRHGARRGHHLPLAGQGAQRPRAGLRQRRRLRDRSRPCRLQTLSAEGPRRRRNPVQITGTGFGTVTEVRFGGVPASFEVVSPTMIAAVSPARHHRCR